MARLRHSNTINIFIVCAFTSAGGLSLTLILEYQVKMTARFHLAVLHYTWLKPLTLIPAQSEDNNKTHCDQDVRHCVSIATAPLTLKAKELQVLGFSNQRSKWLDAAAGCCYRPYIS